MDEMTTFIDAFLGNIERVIVGKRSVIELVLVALLSDGHILFEDVPGVGKTMLARAVATTLGGTFKRIQCTPDLLPSDVTGVSVFNLQTAQFSFRPGPAFVNVLLADEINRATPRTQSSLLECMGEGQITIDGETHELPSPFLVLATQNPVEYEGTFPLPEAQLDRFLLRLQLGYPDFADEMTMIENIRREHPIFSLRATVSTETLLSMRQAVHDVHVERGVREYLLRLVQATRKHPDVALGVSPRGSLALFRASQAMASIRLRDYVTPDDVKALAPATLAHRIIVRPESEIRGKTREAVLDQILQDTEVGIAETVRA
jgi:MoxR-like ATPase